MRIILCVLAIMFAIVSQAQQLLIPYRNGELFGLSNEEGKLVVPATYNHIEWLETDWFETTRRIELKDTLETSTQNFFIRNNTVKLTGLMRQGKIILKDEPFEDYEIIANKCIVTKTERRNTDLTKEQFKKYNVKGKFYCLFNLAGKNLYPGLFRRIQKIDTTGTSMRKKGESRYILFWSQDMNQRHSIFVFDADKQTISDWLVKDAVEIKPIYSERAEDFLSFHITDKNYNKGSQSIDYRTGKFVVSPIKQENKTRAYGNGDLGSNDPVIREVTSERYDDVVAVPMEEKIMADERTQQAPPFATYHTLLKDSLFHITGPKTKEYVSLPEASIVIANQERSSKVFYGPVMYKSNLGFGIVRKGVATGPMYDSLIYFGNYFIATQTINGKKLTGIINADGNPVIPIEYDSIYAGIRFHEVKDMSPTNNSAYRFVLKEADSKYNYSKPYPYSRQFSGNMTVFKNGLCGVLNISGEFTIPMEY